MGSCWMAHSSRFVRFDRGYVSASVDEARALPSFFRVLRVARHSPVTDACEACRALRSEPVWAVGSVCDAHVSLEVEYVSVNERERCDADLALEVLRAGGRAEPRFTGGVAGAQWGYRRPGKRADRDALVSALTADVVFERKAA